MPGRAVERNDKGPRLLVAYQHDRAPVDDWRTRHSVEVLEGAEAAGPTHLTVVVVRDQSKFREEGHDAALVGRWRWRRRIVGFVCGLHPLSPDFPAP